MHRADAGYGRSRRGGLPKEGRLQVVEPGFLGWPVLAWLRFFRRSHALDADRAAGGTLMIEAVCVTVLLTAVSLVLVILFERWK